MALRPEHELHRRRRGRNTGLGVVLVLFVVLVFGLSVAKIKDGDSMEGFDHQPRVSMQPAEPAAIPAAPAGTEPGLKENAP